MLNEHIAREECLKRLSQQLICDIRLPEIAMETTQFPIPLLCSEEEELFNLQEMEVPDRPRRVTFNLDKNEHIYYSSFSDSSSDCTDEEDSIRNTTLAIQPSTTITKEDLMNIIPLRQNNPLQLHYWYPPIPQMTKVEFIDTPTIRSLEFTEKLIEETIQREIAIYPHLSTPAADIPMMAEQASSCSSEESDTTSARSEDLIQPTQEIIEYNISSVIGKEDNHFLQSVYRELETIQDKEVIPCNTIQSTERSIPSLVHDITLEDTSSIYMDIDTPTHHTSPNKGLFLIKIIRAESLDFTIPDIDPVDIECNVYYQYQQTSSVKQSLDHTIDINHEMIIQDVDPTETVSVMLRVCESGVKKKKTIWYSRLLGKKHQDMKRYVHPETGYICETQFLPGSFMNSHHEKPISGTLVLVNNWYTPQQRHRKNKGERAMGKVVVECLYVPYCCHQSLFPPSLEEATEGLYARRYYNTVWQAGYMHKLGGNTMYSQRHYYTLTGGYITAYEDENKKPLYKIPISRAVKLTCDNNLIAEKKEHPVHMHDSLPLLDTIVTNRRHASPTQDTHNYRFQLDFDNQDNLVFLCESNEDRQKWVSLLQVMITTSHKIPEWIHLH